VAWGPLCYASAVSIVRGGSSRCALQIAVSLAHVYGAALYYSTCYVEYAHRRVSYSRPEFLYFWVYYVALNAPWVVVPAAILFTSIRNVRRVSTALAEAESTLRLSRQVHERAEPKKTR